MMITQILARRIVAFQVVAAAAPAATHPSLADDRLSANAGQARHVRLNIRNSTRPPTIWEFQLFSRSAVVAAGGTNHP